MFFHGLRFLGAPGTFPGAPADEPEASTLILWGASRGSSFEKGALGWKVPKVIVEEIRNPPGVGLEGLGGDGYRRSGKNLCEVALMRGVLFLCTGNSCRSQMAEGVGQAFLGGKTAEVFSAGLDPQGIHPLAITVMEERGVDNRSQSSSHVEEIPLERVDLVITLCESAARSCPVMPGKEVLDWGMEDPAAAQVRDDAGVEEQLAPFRQARDLIEERGKALAEKF